jgi:hypothetical protein
MTVPYVPFSCAAVRMGHKHITDMKARNKIDKEDAIVADCLWVGRRRGRVILGAEVQFHLDIPLFIQKRLMCRRVRTGGTWQVRHLQQNTLTIQNG